MSRIRVTYSGLISFGVGLASIVAGIVFTLIVTRKLSVEEFGSWSLIGGLMTYVIVTESAISFWVTREIARGVSSGKTAVLSSVASSLVGVLVYIVVAYFVAKESNVSFEILFFAAILIPATFLNRTLSAINYGWKPHASSYGSLAFEIGKIPIGLLLVYFLHLGLTGAIITTTLAYVVSIIILIVFSWRKLLPSIKKTYIIKWIKLSWISLFPQIYSFLNKLDVLIFTIITGSVVGLAYYAAATAISTLVVQSGSISNALYPKLLQGGSHEYLSENLIRLFYFMIPLTALSITFVKPALFTLNPIYEILVIVALILTSRMFFNTLTGVFYHALAGIENVDFDEKSSYKKYITSKLFYLPKITNVQSVVYVLVLLVGLYIYQQFTSSQLDLVILWAIISVLVEIPITIYLWILVKKNFVLSIPYLIIIKYFVISVGCFGLSYFLMYYFLEYKNNIFEFLPNLMIYVLLAVGSYVVITYITDSRTRNLIQAIVQEFKNKNP